MSTSKRLVVVDDNWRFAVHVWRHLSGMMEFGLPRSVAGDGSEERAQANGLDEFRRIAPDGSLEVIWFNPRNQRGDTGVNNFTGLCDEPGAAEVWCTLDIRGVPDWHNYYSAFGARHKRGTERVWVMSSYGRHDRANVPAARPKTIESLRALARAMELPGLLSASDSATRSEDQIHILVTGAGFERQEDVKGVGESIGCPPTSELLKQMRPSGQSMPKSADRAKLAELTFPLPFAASDLEKAAISGNLDDWWDALFAYFSRNHAGSEATLELVWREAFRRSLLEYDYGQLLQAIAAAHLDWDYWLTTNYSRFTDRAIDMVCNRNQRARWRAITTPIEADAVAPFMSSVTDLAANERVMVKLHGDIGHAWTMAIAAQDKLPDSKFAVRPQLHRMYSVTEGMLLGTLWGRLARRCTWHVVGHGLQDRALVRLMAAVVQRSPLNTEHHMIYVDPAFREDAEQRVDPLALLRLRFEQAGERRFVREALPAAGAGSRNTLLRLTPEPSSALEYMSKLGRRGLAELSVRLSGVVRAGAACEDAEVELEEIGE